MKPQPSAIDSFLRFLFGFFIFIGVSFGVTVAVSRYTLQQQADTTEAAALHALLSSQAAQK